MQLRKLLFLLSILITFNSLAQKNKPSPSLSVEQIPTPPDSDIRLFFIQRSSSIDVILYDAYLGLDKKLDSKNPVHAYWLRYTNGGKKQELSSIQRTLAYGLYTKPISGEQGSYDGHFLAYRKRRFVVKMNAKGQPIALFPINGKMQVLKKVYVNVDESGMIPKVIYVELWGRDAVTDKEVYEKFKP